MLRINLQPIMRRRLITNPRQYLIRNLGVSKHSTDKMLKGEAGFIKLDHLSKICRELNCTPDELLEWVTPENRSPLPADHPLNKLADRKKEILFIEQITSMSSDELKQTMKKLQE